jgi:23S rRNA (uridine2552-2'-O)-methyltransferase
MNRTPVRGRTKLRTASGRTVSQQRWLKRQIDDPYVRRAKAKAIGRAPPTS